MRYVYETAAYGPDPIRDLYWSTTVPPVSLPTLNGSHKTDVAVIGAGFTGLSAAYHLGQAGVDVTVMDAQHPMFGATGRNGGFCCLGGGKISNARLDRLYGSDQRQLYRQAEKAAVDLVDQFISDHDLDVDRHSDGETLLAHKPKHAQDFPALQAEIQRDYGVTAEILEKQELRQNGLGGAFHGAITTPIGFGLNPKNMPADCYKWHKQRVPKSMPTHPPSALCQRHRDTTSQPQTGQYPATNSSSPQMAIHPRICFHGCAHAFYPYSHPSSSRVRSRIRNKRRKGGPARKWPMTVGFCCTISE